MLLAESAKTQDFVYHLKGEIIGINGIGVNNCTVKISAVTSNVIYSYFNTGEKSTFDTKLNLISKDSILIEVSHVSYNMAYIKLNLKGHNSDKVNIVVQPKTNNLSPVEVKAPPVWVRGDTTFHKVDSFKEGDERKLKDILLKLPKFSLDNTGKLLYKEQLIDKITIDGEELFAEKVDLMINNFPIHILNTVQAIENQSSQKILKGLTGENKIFLNLKLNAGVRYKTAFGDGELGIGNKGRYSIAPVIFSVYDLIKVGYIGNWNSIGNGVGNLQVSELKNNTELVASNLLMSNQTLTLINNFENRWYIKNQQWDNRLQINTPISKTIKSVTEIAYLRDKQIQNTYYNSSLYNNNIYQSRIDSNANLYRPNILALKQTFNIRPDSTLELNVAGSIFADESKGVQNSVYNGFGILNPLYKLTDNNWRSFNLSGALTKRKSKIQAVKLFFSVNQQFLKQNGYGNSIDFERIFNVGSGYDNLNNNLNTKHFSINAGILSMRKNVNNRLTNFGLSVDYTRLQLSNLTSLEHVSSESELPAYYPALLNNIANYSIKNVVSTFSRSIKFIAKEAFLFKTDIGLSSISMQEKLQQNDFTNLIIKSSITHNHRLFNYFSSRANVSFTQQAIDEDNIYGIYYPLSITSFKKNTYTGKPLKKIHGDYVIGWTWPNSLTSSSLTIFSDIKFGNLLPIYSYNSFFQYQNNIIVNDAITSTTLHFSHQIPSLFLKAIVDFGVTYNLTSGLQQFNEETLKTKYSFFNANFSIKKNWNKLYFIKLNSSFGTYINKFPLAIQGSAANRVSNFKLAFYQRMVLNKQWNIISNMNFFQNNLFTPNKANFLIADIECNYKFKTRPLFLSLRVDNLTDEKSFYTFSNSTFSQSFGTIPLIRRNFYASIRYNF